MLIYLLKLRYIWPNIATMLVDARFKGLKKTAAHRGASSPAQRQQQQQQPDSLPPTIERPPHYDSDLDMDDDDVPCMYCGSADGEESFVLCDGCPNGGHFQCMGMTGVPEGDWHCVVCVGKREASAAAAAAAAAATSAAPVGAAAAASTGGTQQKDEKEKEEEK